MNPLFFTLILLATLGTSTAFAEKEVEVLNGCTIEKLTLFSPSMNRDIRIIVVLPPAYATSPEKSFPILHTLHGYGAPYGTWSAMSPLREALTDCPMIVTCLDGDKGSWYLDSPEKADSQFTTFFFEEFVPFLEKNYRVESKKQAITGFSMGGFGAFHYMLTQPKFFQSVSSLSGAFYDFETPGNHIQRYLKDILGPVADHPERYAELDLYQRIEETDSLPPIYLHCGTEDSLLEQNQMMTNVLKKKKSPVEYKTSPGGHNWPFWKGASAEVVRFHWNHGLNLK